MIDLIDKEKIAQDVEKLKQVSDVQLVSVMNIPLS